uniref:Ribosomal protein L15 n=1 Tax=Felis catus TaxID=9685 RepID=A0ABI7YG43_FELCA
MAFIMLRVHCCLYLQLPVLHRAPHPTWPDKAYRLGYKAKQGYVIYWIHVRHGGCKRPVPKGAATYGNPVHHDVHQLKFA